jgi:uncharacterized protein
MMHRPLTLVLLAALAVSPAWAQSKKELAAKVVSLQQTDFEGIGRALAAQTAQRVMSAAGQALGQLPADKREAVGRELQADIQKFHDAVAPQLAERAAKLAPAVVQPALEEKFSEEELKAIIAFLESSASRKYFNVIGGLQPAIAEKVVTDTKPSIEPKLKTLEQGLQAKLKAAAGATGAKK